MKNVTFTCLISAKAIRRVPSLVPGTGAEDANSVLKKKSQIYTKTKQKYGIFTAMNYLIIIVHVYLSYFHIISGMPRLHTWISNEALANKSCKQWWLTFTLNQVKVELLQCPHCDLFNIVVHQETHQWCSHMLTGRHARSFGNLFLSLKRTILSNSIYMCKLITNHWDQYTLCGSLLKGKKKTPKTHTLMNTAIVLERFDMDSKINL